MKPDGNNLYTAESKVDPSARFEYLFVVDGKKILDPSNPLKVFNGPANSDASELVMPRYKQPAKVQADPKGKFIELAEPWQLAPITVYLPPGYSAAKKYPVIYTADGGAWKRWMSLPQHVDRLIEKNQIEPVIVVLIDPIENRKTWYLLNPAFLDYLERVVSYVDSNYSTRPNAEGRLHMGTSAGGRATLFLGLERPNLFRHLALLSPSLTGSLTYFSSFFSGSRHPHQQLKIWMSAGSMEGSILEDAKTMEAYLRKQKIKVQSLYTNEGHSFKAWENETDSVLTFFFAKR